MKKIVIIALYFVVSSFFYSSKKVIKEISAYSESWVAGIKDGGRGIEYHLKFKVMSFDKIEFDSLWVNNKVFKTYLANRSKSVSDAPVTFSKNDTITVRASEFIGERTQPVIIKAPILYKGDALLRYKINNKNKYFIIKKITKKATINRP